MRESAAAYDGAKDGRIKLLLTERLFAPAVFVNCWIAGIEVFGIQAILNETEGFAESRRWKEKRQYNLSSMLNVPYDFNAAVCNPNDLD